MEYITLKVTIAELKAMVSQMQDNATFIGCADKPFTDRTIKDVNKVNKMFLRNKIDERIRY